MSDLYPESESKPDMALICFDVNTPIKKIGAFLADLDRDITGYEYEHSDDPDGDDPEVVTIGPAIDGYTFEYGPSATRWPNVQIIFKRDQPLKEQWRAIFWRLAHYNLSVPYICAYRARTPLKEWRPQWEEYARGLYPTFSDFKDKVRMLYGVDFGNWGDYQLAFKWLDYMLNAHTVAVPPETDYYAFTGSLGHGD